ncbi:Eco57I restriction-modification methylase domain-containing protein [Clostridium sp. ZS2-4]|uniref:Eco57I restriction-modification methylase domain-containing protein n=1 Tax=Clostridium sp. ZS2-4 TaxID=2987703 RepID=UPI00227B37BC|nr:TaqI-like C-terminal specificity domain-containing protein [Clostridium sp. ZS2-4]MCY6353895.1 N-6 DNA methylase [Clostridium sp. ZS2-4]
MLNNFLEKIDELYNIINAPIDDIFKIMALKKYKKIFSMDKEKFSDLYIKYLEKDKGKVSGIVYTPYEMADYIAKNTIKSEDIIENPYIKILDPSCGCGNILLACFMYLKQVYEINLEDINTKNNLKLSKSEIIKHIIDNNIFGFDLDSNALRILAIDLYDSAHYFNRDNLINKDFLMDENVIKYDVIIGNPPYIGHKAINKEYSKELKKKYKSIYKDKGDIFYCFFQSALNILNKKGKLAFITSRYFIEAPSGEELRKILKEVCSLYKIVDFYGIRPFKKVGIDPVIIFLINEQEVNDSIEIIKPIQNLPRNKEKFYNSLFLSRGNDYKQFFINKNLLNNKGWILRDEKERNIISKIEKKSFTHLSNICESYQGIITGCDRAFIVDDKTMEEYNLEKDIIKPWIKSSYIDKNCIKKHNKYLIYSDCIEMEEEYPNAIKHIEKQKAKLLQRRECKRGVRKWYELQWGRRREIFEMEKIIFPYKSSNNRFILDKGKYFSADVYCLVLKENVPFTYTYLISLLNSKVYQYYFQTFAKKLGDNIYEYYPNNLMRLCIPTMGNQEEFDDDNLNSFFQFNQEEIGIIEEYIK